MKNEFHFKLTSMQKAELFKLKENTEKLYFLEIPYSELTIDKATNKGICSILIQIPTPRI